MSRSFKNVILIPIGGETGFSQQFLLRFVQRYTRVLFHNRVLALSGVRDMWDILNVDKLGILIIHCFLCNKFIEDEFLPSPDWGPDIEMKVSNARVLKMWHLNAFNIAFIVIRKEQYTIALIIWYINKTMLVYDEWPFLEISVLDF